MIVITGEKDIFRTLEPGDTLTVTTDDRVIEYKPGERERVDELLIYRICRDDGSSPPGPSGVYLGRRDARPSELQAAVQFHSLTAAQKRAFYRSMGQFHAASHIESTNQTPIDMVLHCPACGLQHIDHAEEPRTLDPECVWMNPPHRSHLCARCHHIWRPADVPTNGVDAVKTKGKADSTLAAGARSTAAQPLPESAEWEMREDGKLVRKDRWQTGMRRIVALLWGNRHEFEVDEVVEAVRALCPAPYNDGDDEGLVRAILAAAPPAAAQPVEPTVTPTEAVVGFASWVTCRPGTLPAGEGHDAAPWSEAVHEFVVAQGWPTVRDVFPHNLKRPPLSAPPAASGDSTPPSAPVQGDPSGAPRPEPEAAGQDCHGLDTPERVRFYEHDFYVLSNFSAFTLQWKGHRFDTSEAAYHWEKFSGDSGAAQLTRHFILTAPSAHEAFKIAEHNKPHRRADWDDVKVDIMRDILRAKATQHEYVRRKLLATGDRYLVEDSWRDDFWGWGPNRDGKNMLGRLWMEVRAELRGTEPPQAASGCSHTARPDGAKE